MSRSVVFAVGLDLLDVVGAHVLLVQDCDDYDGWCPGRQSLHLFLACVP
jgi:hypothetical protein